jgi:hypothetical protein
MKWIELTSEYDGKAAGSTHQFEDGDAAVIVKAKLGKETTAPAAVTTAADQAEAALVDSLADRLFTKALEKANQKAQSGNKGRPNYGDINVSPDNALSDPTDGFKSFSDFTRTVHKACTGQGLDKRLELKLKASGASETSRPTAAMPRRSSTPTPCSTTSRRKTP